MEKPFWKDGIRFECQSSGKCCTSRGSYGYVYLTDEDRVQMAKVLGLGLEEFIDKYCDEHDGFYHLKEEKGQVDCTFLKDNQCSVYEGRPTQCRTWPFWPENMKVKAWNRDVVKFCPGIGKGKVISSEEIEKQMKAQMESEAKLQKESLVNIYKP